MSNENPKTCFIVCPLGEEGSDTRKRSDQVLKYIIDPVCKEKGYNVIRSDKISDVDKVDQTIIEKLEQSDLVIADLSDHNPNAFYELGYRTALHKPLILIMEKGQNSPFDVIAIRTIFYFLKDPDKIEECKRQIIETIDSISTSFQNTNFKGNNTIQNSLSDKEKQQQYFISILFNQLLEIKDMINELKDIAESNNSEILERIIKTFTNQMQNNMTPQDKAMEMFFKEYMKNPNKAMSAIIQLNKLNNVKNN